MFWAVFISKTFKSFFIGNITYHVIDEALASWWRLEAQKCCQPAVFFNNDAIHVQQSSNVSTLRGDGDGQCSQEDSGGHPEDRKHY